MVLGRFKTKRVHCRVDRCTFAGKRQFQVPEEKRTDVSIALQMLDDAYQDECDILVLVSGDADLVPPVNLVKTRFPGKTIVVYVPSRSPVRGAAVELRSAADKHRTLPLNLLAKAQFPARLPDGSGGWLIRPVGW